MKITLIYIFLISQVSYSLAQSTQMFLISGNNWDIQTAIEEYSENYSSNYFCDKNELILWQLNSDTLKLIDTLNYNKKKPGKVHKIRHFDDEKWFMIQEEDIDNSTSIWEFANLNLHEYITIIDYISEDSIVIRKLVSDTIVNKLQSFLNNKAYYLKDQIFATIADTDSHDFYEYILMNNMCDTVHYIYRQNPKDLYIKTESGFQRRNFMGGLSYGEDGKFKTGLKSQEFSEWKTSDIDFYAPSSSLDGPINRGFNFFYMYPNSRYIIGKKRTYAPYDPKENKYYVFDKHLNNWDSVILNNYSYYNTFNVYDDKLIYGSGSALNKFPTDMEKDSIIQRNYSKYNSPYGCVPNLDFVTGRFFTYHISDKRFDERVFKERDVELLAINDRILYYRKYDEIRSVALDENLGMIDHTDKVLVRNNLIVPFIHHIFFTPADKLDFRIIRKLKGYESPNE